EGQHDAEHVVADGEPAHTFADLIDGSGEVATEHDREAVLEYALEVAVGRGDIEAVERGVDADANLASPGDGIVYFGHNRPGSEVLRDNRPHLNPHFALVHSGRRRRPLDDVPLTGLSPLPGRAGSGARPGDGFKLRGGWSAYARWRISRHPRPSGTGRRGPTGPASPAMSCPATSPSAAA